MTIKNVDLNDIEPYKWDNKKSFEHLCYQLTSLEYSDLLSSWANLISIDDSGGWSWVEFYIELKNWDIWGWQCKYVDRVSSAKEQIKKSLRKSYTVYGDKLKKWFLCSKNDLTPWEKSWFFDELENTTISWNQILPDKHWVEFVHWWDTTLSLLLQQSPQIHNFFFTSKEYDFPWFLNRYEVDKNKNEIKTKYIQEIHIPTEIDENLNKTLVNEELIDILEDYMEEFQIEIFNSSYKDSLAKLFNSWVPDKLLKDISLPEEEYINIKKEIEKLVIWKQDLLQNTINILHDIKECIKKKDEIWIREKITDFNWNIKKIEDFIDIFRKLSSSDFCAWLNYIKEPHLRRKEKEIPNKKRFLNNLISIFKKNKKSSNSLIEDYSENENKIYNIQKKNSSIRKLREILFWSLNELEEWGVNSLKRCIEVFKLIDLNEHHISWDAWMWKTHIAFNIYEKYIIEKWLPSVFIFAKHLNSELPLVKQLEQELWIDNFWKFIWLLDSYWIQNNSKIPFIIDWLNESKYWKSIWQDQLELILIKIKTEYNHVVFITTYRTSYQEALFSEWYFDYKKYDDVWNKRTILSGFSNLGWEDIKIYLDYYKIELISYSWAINRFSHPLYLRIFCDIKNHERKDVKKVSLQNEDLYEVFDEYIDKANKNITSNLEALNPKYDKNYTINKLLKIWEYLWINNERWVPRDKWFFSSVEELEIFEGENLLIYRDWNTNWWQEEIQFTYDFLWWYLISKYLIDNYKNWYPIFKTIFLNKVFNILEMPTYPLISDKAKTGLLTKIYNYRFWSNWLLSFVKSREFKTKLLDNNTKHPLYDDILRSLSVLLIKSKGIFLFNYRKEDNAIKYWVDSIFEINKSHINNTNFQEFLTTYLDNYLSLIHIWRCRRRG